MTTESMVNQLRAIVRIRGISLSEVGTALIVFGTLWIAIVYLSDIPRLIAASIAEYIGIIAQ